MTLLHPPYTAWHLSYVVLGAVAAPTLHAGRLGATALAFFLAVGIAAHALDERHDRPLRTRLGDRTLALLAGMALALACGIGAYGAITVSATFVPLILLGAAICVAYNLELWGGRLHGDMWFALAWGGLPAFTGYWSSALSLSLGGVLVTVACVGLSAAQRRLSTPARELRRRTTSLEGAQQLSDGRTIALTRTLLLAPLDGALAALSAAITLLALGLLAARL